MFLQQRERAELCAGKVTVRKVAAHSMIMVSQYESSDAGGARRKSGWLGSSHLAVKPGRNRFGSIRFLIPSCQAFTGAPSSDARARAAPKRSEKGASTVPQSPKGEFGKGDPAMKPLNTHLNITFTSPDISILFFSGPLFHDEPARKRQRTRLSLSLSLFLYDICVSDFSFSPSYTSIHLRPVRSETLAAASRPPGRCPGRARAGPRRTFFFLLLLLLSYSILFYYILFDYTIILYYITLYCVIF